MMFVIRYSKIKSIYSVSHVFDSLYLLFFLFIFTNN